MHGYFYEYIKVKVQDVVEVYKNDLAFDGKFVVTNERVTERVLSIII